MTESSMALSPHFALATALPVLTIGWVGGLVGTFLFRALARKVGFVNAPNPIIPQHRKPVAYMGGCGIAFGVLFVLLAEKLGYLPSRPSGIAVLGLPGLAFLVLGLVDDARAFRPRTKLLLQIACAALACALGLTAPIVANPYIDPFLSALWILIVVNAVNLTDVCDGLVGGLAFIGLFVLATFVPEAYLVAFGATGACLGFLVFNRPPASIFLGDAGSHLLGFLLAALGLLLIQSAPGHTSISIALLVVAVPLFEIAFLIWVRTKKNIPWWRGSPDHFSLRLQAAGFSGGYTDLIAWANASVPALCALALPGWPVTTRWVLLLAALVWAIGSARLLLHWEVKPAL